MSGRKQLIKCIWRTSRVLIGDFLTVAIYSDSVAGIAKKIIIPMALKVYPESMMRLETF